LVKITILLENNSLPEQYKSRHGLSILIEHEHEIILLDVGPDNKFLLNAAIKNIDLGKVNYLFLSHNHNDHTGGLNTFLKMNKNAPVYLMDEIDNKYYVKQFFFYIPIGLKINKKYRSRVIQIKNDFLISSNIYFLKNTVSKYTKPTFNNTLYKKEKSGKINDTFTHEGILVLEDNNELLLFDSCSHNTIG